MQLVISETNGFYAELEEEIKGEIARGELNLEFIAHQIASQFIYNWAEELRPKSQLSVEFTEKTTIKEVKAVIKNLSHEIYKLIEAMDAPPTWDDWVDDHEQLERLHQKYLSRVGYYQSQLRCHKATGRWNPERADRGRIPEQDVADAKSVLIRDLYNGRLRLSGGRYSGPCPFHKERTGSFFIFPDNHCHCFSCGFHGGPIDFVMKLHKLDFPKAIKFLLNT